MSILTVYTNVPFVIVWCSSCFPLGFYALETCSSLLFVHKNPDAVAFM